MPIVLNVFSNGHFCTEGKLVWKSVASGEGYDTTPEIYVTNDVVAKFGMNGCSDIECPD